MTTLLYTEKGMEETFKIWEAFGRVRRGYEQWADEDKEAEEADESWGFGELEEVEEARREMNGEYELAIRRVDEEEKLGKGKDGLWGQRRQNCTEFAKHHVYNTSAITERLQAYNELNKNKRRIRM